MVVCAGTAVGAVKIVVPPLVVCAGEKEPQRGALPHVTTQSTPALAGSLLTVADTGTALPTIKLAGGAWVIDTEIISVVVLDAPAFVVYPVQPVIPSRAARPSTNRENTRHALHKDCSLNSA